MKCTDSVNIRAGTEWDNFRIMAKAQQQLVVVGAVLVGVGLVLSSDPNCNKGCKTIAQHLLDHGIGDLLAGLFG